MATPQTSGGQVLCVSYRVQKQNDGDQELVRNRREDAAGAVGVYFFFFKQKTAYEIGQYWSSDVCSSDLSITRAAAPAIPRRLASHAGCASWVSRSAV